jgi:kinesin family protein 2/24
LINGHRKHIDDLVDLVKGEMSLLNDVDKPGSDVSQYVDNLDKLILKKIDMMHLVRQ